MRFLFNPIERRLVAEHFDDRIRFAGMPVVHDYDSSSFAKATADR